VRHESGRFSTNAQHVAAEKISGLERGAAYLLGKVRSIGPQADQWAQAMLAARGIEGTRVLMGLLALDKKHPTEALEKACEIALSHGAFRLRTLRKLIGRHAPSQQSLPFLTEHPIIRPLDDYAAIVARAIHRGQDRPSMGEGFTRHRRTKAIAAHEKSLVAPAPRGPADVLPDSVSPDSSSIAPRSSLHQEI
jgi:hypothetical protein